MIVVDQSNQAGTTKFDTIEPIVNAHTNAKLGIVIENNFLISVIGGLAFMNGSLASSAGYKDESFKAGWNIGGQVEYRVSKALSLTAQ